MDDMQSHLSFFGFREQPFAPTADPVYFYATREHKECLFRLWSSIDEQHGIAVVLGNYGTGKTTLLRKLMTGMTVDRERYNTAVVGSPIPSWTSFALLESIVLQFGLRPGQRSFVAYMEALNRHLLKNRDRINTLLIDDAQNLNKRGQLELLRLVQNLETPQRKLLNLVLFAQLEWMPVLRAAPNFEQRVNMTYTLSPLQFEEVRHFIDFRIKQASSDSAEGPRFDEDAARMIHAYSEGNPRVVVTLCRNAVLLAAHIKRRTIDRELMRHTIEKTTLPNPKKQARIAAALQGGGQPTGTPSTSADTAAPGVSGTDAQDVRAAQLLLRAARTRSSGEQ